MALDSDISNADAQLHVEFYERQVELPDKSMRAVPYVRIMVPGDKTNIIDQPVRDDYKRRFQRQWLFFQMKNSEGLVIGTPLSQWHKDRPLEFPEGQLTELVIMKFQTVEQVAQASDTQIQRVGMGAAGLRERARSYLSAMNAQTSGAELQSQRDQIAALTAMVENLSKMQMAAPLVAAARPTGKRRGAPKGGWPKKVNQNVQHDAATGATGS